MFLLRLVDLSLVIGTQRNYDQYIHNKRKHDSGNEHVVQKLTERIKKDIADEKKLFRH